MSIPLWLFSGPEIGERNAALDAIKTAAQKKHGVLDVHSFYAGDTDIAAVIDILQTGSLFANARFVVLRNAEVLKRKEDVQMIAQWVQGAEHTDDAFFVLISDEISIDKKIEALVPKSQKKIFWELFENKKHEWIHRFFSQLHIRITPEAAEALLELVDNNTEALKTACNHISLFFHEGDTLDAEDIVQMLAHNKEETVFSLFDALVKGNFDYAVSIHQKLTLSKETSAIQIIAGLTYCFRRLKDWHNLAEKGTLDDLSLKRMGFTSKKSIDQYRTASSQWNSHAAQRIIALLTQTDIELRTTGQEMKTVLMERCLYAIMYKKGSPLLQYTPDMKLHG
ncbi:MAG: DNA polymerase III subunit delta [Treponema sp.]